MSSDSDMERLRPRIRAALASDQTKSQKELANLLGISPAQVTSLLKPGGRRLQASEVPIVERYLGIRVFQGEDDYVVAPSTRSAASVMRAAHAMPVCAPVLQLRAEATLVALEDAPVEIRSAMQNLLDKGPAEFWRLATDHLRDAGYLRGDYVVVDRSESPRNGDVVLAEFRQTAGRWIPIFRLYAPTFLQVANSRGEKEPGLSLRDRRIAVIGPVIASFRTRERQ